MFRDNKRMLDERCAPWDQLYGFFYGDGETSRVMMEMTQLPTESAASLGDYRYQSVGNYMLGTSRFRHGYTENANAPKVAFFTGGDRVLECAVGPENSHSPDGATCTAGEFGTLLHNNFEGRFR